MCCKPEYNYYELTKLVREVMAQPIEKSAPPTQPKEATAAAKEEQWSRKANGWEAKR